MTRGIPEEPAKKKFALRKNKIKLQTISELPPDQERGSKTERYRNLDMLQKVLTSAEVREHEKQRISTLKNPDLL